MRALRRPLRAVDRVTIPRGAAATLAILAAWCLFEVWAAYALLMRPRWREDAQKAVHLERNGQGLNARAVAERIPRWVRARYLAEARKNAAGYG